MDKLRRTLVGAPLVALFVGLAAVALPTSTAWSLNPSLDRTGFGVEVVTICDRASSELDSLKNLYADEGDGDSFVAYFSGLDRILGRMDAKLAKLRVADATARSITSTSRSAIAFERKVVKAALVQGRRGRVSAARASIDAAYVGIEQREQAVNAQLVSVSLDECSFFPTTSTVDDSPAAGGPVVFGLDATDAAVVLPPVAGFILTVLPPDARTLPLDAAGQAVVERFDGRVVYTAAGKPAALLIAMKMRPNLGSAEADAYFVGLFGESAVKPVELPPTGAFRRIQLAEAPTGVTVGAVQGRWAVAVIGTEPTAAKQFVAAYFPAVPLLPA